MKTTNWDYPTVKKIALRRFEKEFVLDHAPRCYSQTTNIEMFFEMMEGILMTQRKNEEEIKLREELKLLLSLKIQLLEIKNLKQKEMIKQNYELVATLQTKELSIKQELAELSIQWESAKIDKRELVERIEKEI